MLARLRGLHPFQTGDARRLALLFAVVYFAQGMWYLPNQAITIVLKERGLTAGEVATFFAITTVPWVLKPAYGLLSDLVPLFGGRRRGYFLLTSTLAAVAGLALGVAPAHSYRTLAGGVLLMGLGLAFTDVLTDALMVDHGQRLGLTGAFQAVQWAAIDTASVLVGEIGGFYAEGRDLGSAFLLAAAFPLISLAMALGFVHDPPARRDRAALEETWRAIRTALGDRTVWVVAGFILFWTFSPSFGPALLYYQTDRLGFSQQFIGHLTAAGSLGSVAGAIAYAPLSRRVPLRRLINWSIGAGALGTLTYLAYRGPGSALVIDTVYGAVGMVTQLAFLDLAAKACPRRVEATFFALLMSVYNAGQQASEVAGGHVYDWLGYRWLIFVSAGCTAMAWGLVPLVGFEAVETRARAAGGTATSG